MPRILLASLWTLGEGVEAALWTLMELHLPMRNGRTILRLKIVGCYEVSGVLKISGAIMMLQEGVYLGCRTTYIDGRGG